MLNIVKVVDDIASCELLTEEVKLKALDDLLKMVKDDKYASRCCFIVDSPAMSNYIGSNHVWHYSDLGREFWDKVNEIVYY